MLRSVLHVLAAIASLALLNCSSASEAASGTGSAPQADGGARTSVPVTVDSSGPTSCKADADCALGEGCISGLCGLPRCSATTPNANAPLGKMYTLAPALQVLLANGTDATVASFDGAPLAATDATFTPVAAPSAIAAGRFTATAKAGLAFAQSGMNGVTVLASTADTTGTAITLAFAPVALAARDFDGDGVDEIVALGPAGDVAMCTAATSTCVTASLGGTGVDIAAGDALHDGVVRAVAFTKGPNGKPTLTVWSPTVAGSTPETAIIPTSLAHLAMGDLDGDGHDEVVGLEDRGYLGTLDDALHLYTVTASAITDASMVYVASDSVDLAVGTFDGTRTAQVTLLRSGSVVDEYTGSSFAVLAATSSSPLASPAHASELAIADVRGLSAMGTLTGTPTLTQGKPTPIFAAFYPPFSTTDSSGVSDVILTSTTTDTTQTTQTLSMSSTTTVGFQAGIPILAMTSISAAVAVTLQAASTTVDTLSLAETFTLTASSASDRDDAAVLVAGTCFQAYEYKVSDPQGRLGAGADGSAMAVLQPVGVQRSVWSLTRYNAVAAAVGHLPVLPTSYRLGQPETYPSTVATFAGQPIAADDQVFPQLDAYEATSSARLNLHLTLADSSANTKAGTAALTLSGSGSLFGPTASENLNFSYNESSTLTLGAQTDIQMDVPQLNAGDTNGYSFTPYLYKEHYAPSGGSDASLYVLDFSVAH